MTLFLAVFVIFALLMGLMACGVLLGRKPLQGSCGGLANVNADGVCGVCGRTPDASCRERFGPTASGRLVDPFEEPAARGTGRLPPVRDAAAD